MRKKVLAVAVFNAIERQRQEAVNARLLRAMQRNLMEIEKASAGSVVSWARMPGKTRLRNLWMKARGLL